MLSTPQRAPAFHPGGLVAAARPSSPVVRQIGPCHTAWSSGVTVYHAGTGSVGPNSLVHPFSEGVTRRGELAADRGLAASAVRSLRPGQISLTTPEPARGRLELEGSRWASTRQAPSLVPAEAAEFPAERALLVRRSAACLALHRGRGRGHRGVSVAQSSLSKWSGERCRHDKDGSVAAVEPTVENVGRRRGAIQIHGVGAGRTFPSRKCRPQGMRRGNECHLRFFAGRGVTGTPQAPPQFFSSKAPPVTRRPCGRLYQPAARDAAGWAFALRMVAAVAGSRSAGWLQAVRPAAGARRCRRGRRR